MSSRLDANLVPDSNSESSGERHVPNESELISSQRLETYVSLAESERQRVQSVFGNVTVDTEDCSLGTGDGGAEFVVVDRERPGLALLMGFEHFSIGERRPGVIKDLTNMYDLFYTHLGFEVQTKKDLTVAECMNWFKTVTSDTALLQRVSCVVMVISSHGSEDEVAKGEISRPELRRQELKYYQHRIATTDGSIRTGEIISMFDDMNCRALKGKPKIFFIQACRSRTNESQNLLDFVDTGVQISVKSEPSSNLHPSTQYSRSSYNNPVMQCGLDETDSLPDAKGIRAKNIKSGHKIFVESSERLRASVEEEIVLAPPPCIHNSVIVMASPPGKVAWSEVQDGGWLIMGLYKVLMQYVDNRHKIRLIRAITRINHLIALTMHTITNDPSLNFMKCMPVMTHTLERDIVFVPRNIQ